MEKAADLLKQCLNINPKHVPGLVAMGNLLLETGFSKHAIKYHQQALKINPKETLALKGLANALYDMNEY